MNKYSELSDFEINEIVSNLYFYKKGYRNILDQQSIIFNLIIDNKISLEIGKNCWHASDGDKLSVSHENPCRAIAECYLLMKDAEIE